MILIISHCICIKTLISSYECETGSFFIISDWIFTTGWRSDLPTKFFYSKYWPLTRQQNNILCKQNSKINIRKLHQTTYTITVINYDKIWHILYTNVCPYVLTRGLAVASIAWDDPPLFPACTQTTMHPHVLKVAVHARMHCECGHAQ